MTSIKPVSLAYKIFESSNVVKEANPIIFLHGIGASKEHWVDIPQKVADATHRRVYAVDARDHGDSEWSGDLSPDINVLDLTHFIETISAKKVILVGHSMGGMTSMRVALKMPSKIEKIVIEDIAITVPKEIGETLKFLFSLIQEALTNIPAGSTMEEAIKFIPEYVLERVPEEAKVFMKNSDRKYKDFLKQNPDGSFSYRANLKAILRFFGENDSLKSVYEGVYDGPSCFIYGKKSQFPVCQDATNIKKLFPNAQFVGIEDATHDVHSDAPLRYTEALLKFLRE